MIIEGVLKRRSELLDKKLGGKELSRSGEVELALMRAILDIAETARDEGYERGLADAARVGYATCAETRHVTLGDKVETNILALKRPA